jgi:hypothetical protein
MDLASCKVTWQRRVLVVLFGAAASACGRHMRGDRKRLLCIEGLQTHVWNQPNGVWKRVCTVGLCRIWKQRARTRTNQHQQYCTAMSQFNPSRPSEVRRETQWHARRRGLLCQSAAEATGRLHARSQPCAERACPRNPTPPHAATRHASA